MFIVLSNILVEKQVVNFISVMYILLFLVIL